jgi:hypothetical protein
MNLEDFSTLLDYNRSTGVFTWKVRRPHKPVGSVAGSARPDGYWKLAVKGKSYLAHRVAWLFINGEWPRNVIDHKNGNKQDNRAVNLRDVSTLDNMHNQHGMHVTNKSGYRGVSWNKATQKWTAFISIRNKTQYLGQFNTPEEAYEAYINAKQAAHSACNFNPMGFGEKHEH